MQEMIVYLLIQIQTAWEPKDNEEFVVFCLSSQEIQTCLNKEENMTPEVNIIVLEQIPTDFDNDQDIRMSLLYNNLA